MAAKIIIAFLVALCASQVTVGYSLTTHEKDLLKWAPSDITEWIEKLLAKVEDVIEEVDNDVIKAVNKTLVFIDDELNSFAEKWKEDIKKLVNKTEETEKEIKECWDDKGSLKTLWKELKNETEECVEVQIKDVKNAAKLVKATGYDIIKEVNSTLTMISDCLNGDSVGNVTLCVIEDTATYVAKFVELDLQLAADVALVVSESAQFIPVAGLCIAKCAVGKVAEAQEAVETLVTCIAKAL